MQPLDPLRIPVLHNEQKSSDILVKKNEKKHLKLALSLVRHLKLALPSIYVSIDYFAYKLSIRCAYLYCIKSIRSVISSLPCLTRPPP